MTRNSKKANNKATKTSRLKMAKAENIMQRYSRTLRSLANLKKD